MTTRGQRSAISCAPPPSCVLDVRLCAEKSWDLHEDFFVSRARWLPLIEDSFFPNIYLASHVLAQRGVSVSVVYFLKAHSPQGTADPLTFARGHNICV